MGASALPGAALLRTGTLYKIRKYPMPTETTYTRLRENLASVLDQVVDQQETVIVRRRGARDVALVPASKLAGLIEPLTSCVPLAMRDACSRP